MVEQLPMMAPFNSTFKHGLVVAPSSDLRITDSRTFSLLTLVMPSFRDRHALFVFSQDLG